MDMLRSTIGLRAYAQKDPLVEYKQEAFRVFDGLMREIDQEILNNMFRSATSLAAFERIFASLPQRAIHQSLDQFSTASAEDVAAPVETAPQEASGGQPQRDGQGSPDIQISFKREAPKVGRNDNCPCGSGKKFKKCCGR
jgi:preprotein translocase subunit SecA